MIEGKQRFKLLLLSSRHQNLNMKHIHVQAKFYTYCVTQEVRMILSCAYSCSSRPSVPNPKYFGQIYARVWVLRCIVPSSIKDHNR